MPGGVVEPVTGGGDRRQGALTTTPAWTASPFTGSYDVGCEIYRAFAAAATRGPCIAEMGGKNPAIVTATADLDKAANGILRSAFGASGQKCSACSRVLVEATVARRVVARLAEKARSRGRSATRAADVLLGPAHQRRGLREVPRAADDARRDGTVVAGGGSSPTATSPTATSWRRRSSPTCRRGTGCCRDELFVPFVAVAAGRRPGEAHRRGERPVARPHGRPCSARTRPRASSSSTASRPASSTSTARPARPPAPGPASRLSAAGRAPVPPANRPSAALRPAVHARAVAHDSPVR